ncbi:MAG: hypothetical protein WCH74_14215 [Chloroflexota bacterium]
MLSEGEQDGRDAEEGRQDRMDGEQIIGVIGDALRKSGTFRSTAFTLVVTDRRVIAAQVTDAVKRAHVAEQKAAGGGSHFGGLFGRGGGEPLADRYLRMNPEAIIAESPDNLLFVPGLVSDVVVMRGKRLGDENATESYLFIRLTDARGAADYSTSTEIPSHADALFLFRSLFGPIVRTG